TTARATSWRRRTKSKALALVLLLAACAAPPPKKTAPPAPRVLTAEEKTRVEREFFWAVDAYSKGEYENAETYVAEILELDPNNKDALALRERMRAIRKLK